MIYKPLLFILIVVLGFFLANIYFQHLDLSINPLTLYSYMPLLQEILLLSVAILILMLIKNRVLKIVLISLIFLIFAISFIVQALSVDITGDVINLASLKNAGQAMLLLNTTLIVKITILVTLFAIIYFVIFKYNAKFLEVIALIIILITGYSQAIKFKHKNYQNYNHLISFAPVTQLYSIIKLDYQNKKESITKITQKEINVAKKFNIIINPKQKKPFEKDFIYKEPLAYKKISQEKPNVIIFFIESFSARLLGAYGNSYPNLTPNIDDFAKHSMIIKGYYNHATPTAPALYGQNCSIYPLLTFDDMDKTPNILRGLKIKCMASFAKDLNYTTYYFSHSRGYHTHFDQDFKLWGYDKLYFWRDFTKTFLDTDNVILGKIGASDHQMMQGLTNFLKENNSTKPFFLGLSTIESHVGFKTNSVDGIKYGDGESETLNLIHNLDDSFGIFWNYFKKSPYFKNTIVILTGDHALYPNRDYKEVAGKGFIPSVYDKLSLIIYDPTHKLPKEYSVNATSVDLAPTVLQLIGIKKDSKNSFIGRSIFDKREYNNTFGISAYSDFNFYMNLNGRVVNHKISRVKDKNISSLYYTLKKILKYSQYLRSIGKY